MALLRASAHHGAPPAAHPRALPSRSLSPRRCAEALEHTWLSASNASGSAAKPLPAGLAKKRRQSQEIRLALQHGGAAEASAGGGGAAAPRGSQPTAAFTELEQMRTAQEQADAEALLALMKRMDADDEAAEAAEAATAEAKPAAAAGTK